jgi:hypothetical protein
LLLAEVDGPRRIASLVRDHLIEGVARGEGDADWSSLELLAARRAGLPYFVA